MSRAMRKKRIPPRPTRRRTMEPSIRRREALLAASNLIGWFLIPPVLFWIAFVLALFDLWRGPLDVYHYLPPSVQFAALALCPTIVVTGGVLRILYDREFADRRRAAWSLTVFGALFLVLTILGAANSAILVPAGT